MLSATLGRPVLTDLLRTPHFAAGATLVVLALALGVTAMWLRSRPRAVAGWAAVGLLAVLIVTSGAWLTHAAGRIEHRGPLMLLTVAHMLAAAVWVGGLVQLGALWRLGRHDATAAAAWPVLARRFSTLAAAAVGALVLSALPLTWTYAGSWQALVGTGYGSLVLTKAALLLAVLGVAFVNRRAVRADDGLETASHAACSATRGGGDDRPRHDPLRRREPVGPTPAADQSPADTATVGEVVEVFRPKVPSLHMPSPEAMRQSRTAMAAGAPRTREAYLWSNFSHNVSGLILLGTSLFGLVGLAFGARWYRHWPLGFVALAAFVSLRAAANEGVWPLGPTPLWHVGAEALQHGMAAGLVLTLGLTEWRARASVFRAAALPYVLPVLAGAGSVLLLTHSHAAFQSKASFLVQVTHSTMGALAALLAAARWLEIRLSPPASRWAGIAASLAMVGIALVLVFYQEANLTFDP